MTGTSVLGQAHGVPTVKDPVMGAPVKEELYVGKDEGHPLLKTHMGNEGMALF